MYQSWNVRFSSGPLSRRLSASYGVTSAWFSGSAQGIYKLAFIPSDRDLSVHHRAVNVCKSLDS